MSNDHKANASAQDGRSAAARVPGAWQAAVIAAVAAALAGYLGQAWARPGADAAGAADVSRVAEVAPQDIPAALDTVTGTPEQIAQFRQRDACSRRLAWVTVMRGPGVSSGGQAGARIRLQSGNYFSPAFDLAEAPVRVALPYPAPYATGRGTISVVGATTDAVVALTPAWHVSAQGGIHAREVTWTPSGDCPAASK